MTMPRCIGLMTPGWPGRNTPNGIATSVYNLALGLQSIGQTFVILTRKVDGPCPDGVPVVQIDSEDWSWMDKLRYRCGDRDIPHLLIARQIARAVQRARTETGLDVLVMEETNGWAGMVRQLTGVPVVLTLHGPWILHKTIQPAKGPRDSADRERREDRAFKNADGLISPSKNVLEAVEDAVALSNTPTVILPNTLPVSLFPQRSADLATRNILFVGRFERLKGGDTVLAAFARLCRTYPKARLTFAGIDKGIAQPDGSLLHIEQALAQLPEEVRTQITFTGPASREEIETMRSEHAIALIASRYENLNYTMLEAMAAGQAIVSTKVGGPAEVLEDGRTALLVPPGDPAAMAAALARLQADSALVSRLGQAAQDKLAQDFNPATVAARTVSFLKTALNRA